MKDFSELIIPPDESLFFSKNDVNDVRLGEIVSRTNYAEAEIVIVGCPQDEGVKRNGGRIGAAAAPDKIREQFYKFTNFGIDVKIYDLGNTAVGGSLEEIHDRQTEIIRQLLKDGKIIISLGGGNDISYPDCRALSETDGAENVLAINIDAHFDVRADFPRNSGTPYRRLLEKKLVYPKNFYEIGWQKQTNSVVYFEYLRNLDVNLISLDEYELKRTVFSQQIAQNTKFIFWGFDTDVVHSSDAPGVSATSSLGLSANEFCNLAILAGTHPKTKIIEFTEVNPNFDIDNRTTKLIATGMHKFCSAYPQTRKAA